MRFGHDLLFHLRSPAVVVRQHLPPRLATPYRDEATFGLWCPMSGYSHRPATIQLAIGIMGESRDRAHSRLARMMATFDCILPLIPGVICGSTFKSQFITFRPEAFMISRAPIVCARIVSTVSKAYLTRPAWCLRVRMRTSQLQPRLCAAPFRETIRSRLPGYPYFPPTRCRGWHESRILYLSSTLAVQCKLFGETLTSPTNCSRR